MAGVVEGFRWALLGRRRRRRAVLGVVDSDRRLCAADRLRCSTSTRGEALCRCRLRAHDSRSVREGLGKALPNWASSAALLRRAASNGSTRRVHWALRDVSFDIAHGEVRRHHRPQRRGQEHAAEDPRRASPSPPPARRRSTAASAALLEVGTGFHPELTGRENIFLNGAILGMRRAEIDAALRRDRRVRRSRATSSTRRSSATRAACTCGWRSRSRRTSSPEILIVDEVLAVGDVQFQKKCLGKMGDVSRRGRTVLFVSHNMAAVRQLTTRCLVLGKGRLSFDGEPGAAIERYADAMSEAFTRRGRPGPLAASQLPSVQDRAGRDFASLALRPSAQSTAARRGVGASLRFCAPAKPCVGCASAAA